MMSCLRWESNEMMMTDFNGYRNGAILNTIKWPMKKLIMMVMFFHDHHILSEIIIFMMKIEYSSSRHCLSKDGPLWSMWIDTY